MLITLNCPKGHVRRVDADERTAGKSFVCDECGYIWTLPDQDSALINTASESTAVAVSAQLEIPCPKCAEVIKAAAKVCRFCGHEFDAGEGRRALARAGSRSPAPRRSHEKHLHLHQHGPVQPLKSPGLAAVLSFFWSGLGHVYCGEFLIGFMLMQLPWIGYVALLATMTGLSLEFQNGELGRFEGLLIFLAIGLLATIVYWAQIVAAYRCAERKNVHATVPQRSVLRLR